MAALVHTRAHRNNTDMNNLSLAELNRKIENMVRHGVVEDVKPSLCTVRLSETLVTDWLQYQVPAAGGVSVHRMPSRGEACTVLSPSGNLEAGRVVFGFASNQYPEPSQAANETVVLFPDSARVVYDHAASHLDISGIATANITASGSTLIKCPDNTVDGNLNVTGLTTCSGGLAVSGGQGSTAVFTGDIDHNGTFKNTGRLESNGVILDTHTHGGVMAGGANTGKPS